MLSAHGSAPEVVQAATDRSAVMVDAVCPLVTKVHHEAKKMSAKGFDIISVGHHGHDEALGTVAEAPKSVTLVDPRDGLGDFTARDERKVALVAQTTLGLYEWEGVLDDARGLYPNLSTARKSDLCYATTNRQSAVQTLAEQATLILVVGSENSSNTNALVRVARNAGADAYRIDGPDDIDQGWLAGHDIVGVTSGASAPDQRVQEVVARLDPSDGVASVAVIDESEYFPLPPALRQFIGVLQAAVEGAFAARAPGEKGPIEEDRQWGATEALGLLEV
jgi:4-hydroxy-3-methylbut-2-enyl diphosphate reductase